MRTLLEARNLAFRFGSDQVLEGVDLSIQAGDRIVIVGPNGGGKTTLIRLLLGLLRPSRGRIQWGDPRPRLGYLPQVASFERAFPLRVEEVVAHGWLGVHPPWRGLARSEKEAVQGILEEVGLASFHRSYLAELSGGQLRRVLLARALVSRPELLVLDEPTASLDAAARARLWEILRGLPDSATVLLVTHDLEPGSFRATRAIVVEGRVRELESDGLGTLGGWCGHVTAGEP